MDGLFFETSRFELPARGPRGLWPFSRLGTRGTRRRLTCWSHVHRGQVKGAVMEGPCSVEKRLLTGNLKWLHWLVVIHHLILPVGLLTSFKVPSRIGGISAPPAGDSPASTRLSRGAWRPWSLSRKGMFPCPWSGFHGPSPKSWDAGGAGVPGAFQWPVADRPTAAPLPQWPVTSDHHCPPPTAHHHPPVPRDVALHHRLVFNSTAPLPARSVLLLIPAYTTIPKNSTALLLLLLHHSPSLFATTPLGSPR